METLLRYMPKIKPGVVDAVMKSLLSPASGLTPKAGILTEGVKVVLDLRARYGSGKVPLTDPSRYIDLRYYEDVVGRV